MSEVDEIYQLERQLVELDHPSNISDHHQKIDILNELAWYLFDIDNKRSRELSETASALAESADDGVPYEAGLAYSLRTQGFLDMRSGDYSSGLEQFIKALQIFESLQLKAGLSDVFDGMACIYFFVGDYPQAIEMTFKQLAVAQDIGDKRRIANANNNLANIHFDMGDLKQCVDVLIPNLKLAEEIKYNRLVSATLIKLEQAYLATGENQLALENGLRGLQMSRELGLQVFEVRALRLLAQYYSKINDGAQTVSLLEEALDLSRKLESKPTEVLVLLTMGEVYQNLHQLERAKEALHQAIRIAQSLGANYYLSQGHWLLSNLYEQFGDSAQALIHLKQHYALKMHIAGEKSDQRVRLLETLHNVEKIKNESEIALSRSNELENSIIEKEKVQHQLQHQLEFSHALAQCSQTLLIFGDTLEKREQILEQALEHLRVGAQASSAYLYCLNEDTELGRCLGIYAEVCAPGNLPSMDDPNDRKAPWTRMPAAMFEALQAGKPIIITAETFSTGQFDELTNFKHPKDLPLSVVFIPIFIQEQIWGVLGVDDYVDPRQWDEGEITMLQTASGMIASALRRWKAKDKVELQLIYTQALSACSQILLSPSDSVNEFQNLLSQALQHLVEASGAGSIKLLENIEDPRMGFSFRVVCRAFASAAILEKEEQENLPKYRETFLGLSNKEFSNQAHFQEDIVPWSLFPDELPQQLANGNSVGISIKELQESRPRLAEYVSNVVHIKSLQYFPIIFNDQWWGTLSLDDRSGREAWGKDELLMLQAASEIIKNSLQRWRAELGLRSLNDQLERRVEGRTAELSDTVKKLRNEVKERQRAEKLLEEMMGSLEQHLIARTNELATFFDLILMAGQGIALDEIFEYVVPQLMEFTESESVVIDLVQADGDMMDMIAQGNLPEEAPARIYISQFPPELKRWMQGPNEPLLISNLAQEIPSFNESFHLENFPFQSYLGVQIRVGDRIDGILSCFRTERGGYGVDVVALVTAVAQQLGLILEIDRLRQLGREKAVLEERDRLARDLHDSVTQSLYSLTLFARAGREAVEDGDNDRLRAALANLESNTLQTLREMRLLVYELHPVSLEDRSLVQAVESRLNTVERRTGLNLDVRMDEVPGLSLREEVDLYYIIVESLNNIIKHASATHVTLELFRVEDGILLRIVDNGRGFDPAKTNGGMGIANIKERIARLNGQLSIFSQPGEGTQLKAMVPCSMEKIL